MLEFKTERDIQVEADELTLMDAMRITPYEAKILQKFLTGMWVGVDELPFVLASFRQHVHNLRTKLRERHGIIVHNDAKGKYGLAPDGKRAVAIILKEHAKAHRLGAVRIQAAPARDA
jgi:hypothetical protein